MRKRGQSSIEYLTLAGFALVIITVLTLVYFDHAEESKFVIGTSQVERIVRKLVDTAEEVYFLGKPTKTTVKIYMPDNVDQIIMSDNELNFRVRSRAGFSDIEYPSSVNLTGSISTARGIKFIEIRAEDGYVWIGEE